MLPDTAVMVHFLPGSFLEEPGSFRSFFDSSVGPVFHAPGTSILFSSGPVFCNPVQYFVIREDQYFIIPPFLTVEWTCTYSVIQEDLYFIIPAFLTVDSGSVFSNLSSNFAQMVEVI